MVVFITLIIVMILLSAFMVMEVLNIDDDIKDLFEIKNPDMAIIEEANVTENVKIIVFPVFETKSI